MSLTSTGTDRARAVAAVRELLLAVGEDADRLGLLRTPERLGQQIADALVAVLQPHGVAVRIEATHGCVAHLEPRAAASRAVTVATVGSIPDATWRLAVREPAAS